MPGQVSYTSNTLQLNPIHQELPGGRQQGGFLPRTHFTAEASTRGIIMVQPGLVVSQLTGGLLEDQMTVSQMYYVPCTPGSLYGTGTNVPAGILSHQVDLSVFDQTITPVHMAWAFEEECYIAGGALGDIPAAIKTTLTTNGIQWML